VEPYLFVNAALCGFFAFAGMHYAVLWGRSRSEPVLLLFAAQCILSALFCPVLLALILASSVTEAQGASVLRVSIGVVVHGLAFYVLALLSGRTDRRWARAGLIAAVSLALLNLRVPLCGVVVALDPVPLPGGGTGSAPVRTGAVGWLPLVYVVIGAVYGYGIVVARGFWRRDRTGGALIATACLVNLLAAVLAAGVDILQMRAVYAGAFPHAVFVLCMGIFLSREYSDRASRLAASERRFEAGFEHAPIGMAIATPEGRWLRVNRALSRMLGYSAEELEDPSLEAGALSADFGPDVDLARRLKAGELDSYQTQKRYVRKDGEAVWTLTSVAMVRDSDGNAHHAISQIEDITERVKAEHERDRVIHDRGERVKELTALHAAAVILSRQHGEPFALLAELAATLPPAFQYPEVTAARIRLGDLEVRTPGFDPLRPALAVEFTAGGCPGRLEVVYLEDRPAEVEGPFLTEERHLLTSFAEMVTSAWERWQARDELTRSEERYRSLVTASSQVIWTTDRDGAVVEDIPSLRALTGQTREELLAPGGWLQPVHPEDRARAAEAWRGCVRTRTLYEIEYRIRAADGSYRHLAVRGVPVLDERGAVREWIGASTDVTERVRLQREFLQAQKMEAVGRLAGSVAHDFNTMLAVINGFAELCLDGTPEADPRRAHLRQVLRAGERANALTRQLLVFSRKDLAAVRRLQVNDLVADMHRMLQRLIGEDLTISLDLADDVWAICADAGQLEQVVMNLVVNARDAMPAGGAITIRTRNVSLDPKDLHQVSRGVSPGEHVMLAVSDTGTGIDPAVLPNIFEPFFTTKPLGEGTGLGLATVCSIIEQAKGGLQVESQPGSGTTFRIYLPRVPSAFDGAGSDAAATNSRATETSLVV